MSIFSGTIVINLKDIQVENEEGLRDAISWLIPTIAKKITSYDVRPENTTTVTGDVTNVGPGGVSGSVTVTTTGNNGSLSGTVSGGTNGSVTGGKITATYTF